MRMILYLVFRSLRLPGLKTDHAMYRSKLEAEIAELRAERLPGQSRAPVTLDQQSVGRLSRMDAMQQQSMDLARGKTRTEACGSAAALKRMDEDEFGIA